MAPITTHAAHQHASRATDPLNYVWGSRYTELTVPFKILTWISSVVLSALFLAIIGGIAFLVLWVIGLLVFNIFRVIFRGAIFVVCPIIDAGSKLRNRINEGRGRRRERQDERNRHRERGPGSGMRGRSRNVGNVNVQVGHKEGDVEMGRLGRLNWYDGKGMRNMGPQKMGGLPPAYSAYGR